MQWYASASTVNVVYCSCELYVGSTLIAKSTEKLINTTTSSGIQLHAHITTAAAHGTYNLTSSTTFTFRIKFRNTAGGPTTCTYYAWTDFSGTPRSIRPHTVSYPGSGAYVMTSSGSWVKGPVKVWNGSSWVRRPVKVFNGSSWVTH
jgi:hypothetical protein